MKQYPSISREVNRELQVLAFDKRDGSNIRVEWAPKAGFCKFGSRKKLIDKSNALLGKAIELIEPQKTSLESVLKSRKYQKVILYFEFEGTKSFAGRHEIDDVFTLWLIDVEVSGKGFMDPRDFVDTFGSLPNVSIPKVVYAGKITEEVEADIRSGRIVCDGGEGVVCKTSSTLYHKPMFKIKTDAWVAKVKSMYSDSSVLEDLL